MNQKLLKELFTSLSAIMTRAVSHPAFNQSCYETKDFDRLCKIGGDEFDWTLTAIDAEKALSKLNEIMKGDNL